MTKVVLELLALVFAVSASGGECVNPEWTVKDRYLAFDAVMENVGGDSRLSMNFDEFLESEEARRKAAGAFDAFEFPEKSSMTAVLAPTGRGTISVKIVMGDAEYDAAPASEQAAQTRKLVAAMAGTVQLRGEMTSAGKITSFYVPQRQKNLLNIFFELPGRCVAVGDEWSLDTSLIEMDHNFIADEASRVNTVTLAAIEQDGGSTIAVFDYLVTEAVSGTFIVPVQNRSIPTTMNMGFIGRGRFDVTNGRWQQLAGTMRIETTGVMTTNTHQVMALRPAKDVPDSVLTVR